MPVRIMHTADHHIGLEFRNQPALQDKLKEERLDALRRIVSEANTRACHFLAVAGDLFENVSVPQKLIREVCGILRAFNGDVLVVPGNHDYYEGPESRLWRYFTEQTGQTNVHLLVNYSPAVFHADGREVRFYPAHCPSKHGKEHVIGWVSGLPKDQNILHIGIAHGNVEGLGRDDEGNYFNMSQQDLRSAGMHCWLLGHIHAPSPAPGYVGPDLFFMPGTHTPEHVKRTTEGYAWYIEYDDALSPRYERFRSGNLLFKRVQQTLMSSSDIEVLRRSLDLPEKSVMILDLRLEGRLTEDELNEVVKLEQELKDNFLSVTLSSEIVKRIDVRMISAEFPDGTYPNRLLHKLTERPEDSQALQLAYDIIKGMPS